MNPIHGEHKPPNPSFFLSSHPQQQQPSGKAHEKMAHERVDVMQLTSFCSFCSLEAVLLGDVAGSAATFVALGEVVAIL
jgi:hypothetical protein